MGKTWTDIATQLGYSGPGSACKQITTWARKQPPEALSEHRMYSVETRRMVMTQLWELTATAKRDGKISDAVTALRAIADIQDRQDRILGIQPTPAEITVNVTGTAASVIDQAEQQLLAIAASAVAQQPALVLDAEVVEA
jgi:phage major head subunit gpT-like protein